MSTHCGGGDTQHHSLITCHPDGALVAVEEDAAAVTELLFVHLISKGRKVIVCLLVGEKKIKLRSSPWILPDVDMHACKKTTC
jgi:hypothetical protein